MKKQEKQLARAGYVREGDPISIRDLGGKLLWASKAASDDPERMVINTVLVDGTGLVTATNACVIHRTRVENLPLDAGRYTFMKVKDTIRAQRWKCLDWFPDVERILPKSGELESTPIAGERNTLAEALFYIARAGICVSNNILESSTSYKVQPTKAHNQIDFKVYTFKDRLRTRPIILKRGSDEDVAVIMPMSVPGQMGIPGHVDALE